MRDTRLLEGHPQQPRGEFVRRAANEATYISHGERASLLEESTALAGPRKLVRGKGKGRGRGEEAGARVAVCQLPSVGRQKHSAVALALRTTRTWTLRLRYVSLRHTSPAPHWSAGDSHVCVSGCK